jgi:hypothetical protein
MLQYIFGGRLGWPPDDQVANFFHFPRNKLPANEYRATRAQAFSTWAEIAAAQLAA